jgi:hypothetical protein
LISLKRELIENLEQLDEGVIEKSAGSILHRMFEKLTFRKTEEKKPIRKSVIYSIFIGTHNSEWKLLLQNEKNGTSNNTNYLLGFQDLWINLRKSMLQQQGNYFTVSRGAVFVEKSEHFQLFTLGDHLDYVSRVTIQNLLPELENFSFRHIPEELEEKVLKTLNKNIGKFVKVE